MKLLLLSLLGFINTATPLWDHTTLWFVSLPLRGLYVEILSNTFILGAAILPQNRTERERVGLVRVHVERNDADVDPPGDYFVTPLQIAAKCGHEDMVKLLLNLETEVGSCDGKLGTALHEAAYNGSLRTVETLLYNGADVYIVAGEFGTVMQAAVCSSSTSKALVRILLDAGADPSATGGRRNTALQAAASIGKFEIFERLQAIAEIETQHEGPTALKAALAQGDGPTASLLLHGAVWNR